MPSWLVAQTGQRSVLVESLGPGIHESSFCGGTNVAGVCLVCKRCLARGLCHPQEFQDQGFPFTAIMSLRL